MKKFIYLLCLGTLGLASCTQDEWIGEEAYNPTDGAITFRARAFKSTRAAELTTANLQEFSVFAYKGDVDELKPGQTMTDWFGGAVQFSRTTDENGLVLFTSQKSYYYPTDGNPLTFIAYAPSNVTGLTSTPQGELVINEFTVKENIANQEDLITEVTPAWKIDGDGDGVSLYFDHALAKVYVSAAWNNNEEYTYEVVGVKLANIAKTGKYIFNKFGREADFAGDEEVIPHEWTPSEALGDITYIFDAPVTIGATQTPLMSGGMDENGEVDNKGAFLMIPQQLTHVKANPEQSDSENVTQLKFQEGVAYVGLLIRITHNKSGDVIYPYAKGTDNVSQEVNGVKYAWAAFPVASTWDIGHFTDYVVDFTDGAGFIPGGAEGYDHFYNPDDPENYDHIDLEYKPVLGTAIRFMEEVGDWTNGNQNTLGHTYEGVVNVGGGDDFFE